MYRHLIGIAACRAFIPISTLLFIYFLAKNNDETLVSFASFIFATSQLVSQIDGGAPAYLMSKDNGREYNLFRLGIFYYLKTGFIWITICITGLIVINSILNFIDWRALVLIYMLATSLSIYNVAASVFTKKNDWMGAARFVLVTSIMQLCAIIIVAQLIKIDVHWLIVVYSLILLACTVPYVFRGQSGHVESAHANKLQYSQIASSLIINKEYLLLFAASQHADAALYSLVGRVMYIPMQATGLYLSRLWANLTESTLCKRELIMLELKRTCLFTFALTIPIALYQIWKGVPSLLVLALLILNIANTSSGVLSAFSSVTPKSIPEVTWFLGGVGGLYLFSVCFYWVGWWYMSVIATSLFLCFYSIKIFHSLSVDKK